MIDTDLLLLPAMSHYFLDLPQGQGRAEQFFAQNATLQNGTYAEIMNRYEYTNHFARRAAVLVRQHTLILLLHMFSHPYHRTILYNLERATPFAQSPNVSNLIGLRPGQPVGNWRDSNEGLGYGFYPFDVNTALVPASLRATQALLAAGLLNFTRGALEADALDAVAGVWEARAPALFEVRVGGTEAEARLAGFVQAANLSAALLEANSSAGGGGGSGSGNVSFYALSLMEDGTPVEVLNSDMSFNLVYGANVSREFLQHVVDALQPYPRGMSGQREHGRVY